MDESDKGTNQISDQTIMDKDVTMVVKQNNIQSVELKMNEKDKGNNELSETEQKEIKELVNEQESTHDHSKNKDDLTEKQDPVKREEEYCVCEHEKTDELEHIKQKKQIPTSKNIIEKLQETTKDKKGDDKADNIDKDKNGIKCEDKKSNVMQQNVSKEEFRNKSWNKNEKLKNTARDLELALDTPAISKNRGRLFYKKRGPFSKWKVYFSLLDEKQHQMNFYKSAEDYERLASCKLSIDLRFIERISPMKPGILTNKHPFKLFRRAGLSNVKVACDTEEERAKWITAIEEQMERIKRYSEMHISNEQQRVSTLTRGTSTVSETQTSDNEILEQDDDVQIRPKKLSKCGIKLDANQLSSIKLKRIDSQKEESEIKKTDSKHESYDPEEKFGVQLKRVSSERISTNSLQKNEDLPSEFKIRYNSLKRTKNPKIPISETLRATVPSGFDMTDQTDQWSSITSPSVSRLQPITTKVEGSESHSPTRKRSPSPNIPISNKVKSVIKKSEEPSELPIEKTNSSEKNVPQICHATTTEIPTYEAEQLDNEKPKLKSQISINLELKNIMNKKKESVDELIPLFNDGKDELIIQLPETKTEEKPIPEVERVERPINTSQGGNCTEDNGISNANHVIEKSTESMLEKSDEIFNGTGIINYTIKSSIRKEYKCEENKIENAALADGKPEREMENITSEKGKILKEVCQEMSSSKIGDDVEIVSNEDLTEITHQDTILHSTTENIAETFEIENIEEIHGISSEKPPDQITTQVLQQSTVVTIAEIQFIDGGELLDTIEPSNVKDVPVDNIREFMAQMIDDGNIGTISEVYNNKDEENEETTNQLNNKSEEPQTEVEAPATGENNIEKIVADDGVIEEVIVPQLRSQSFYKMFNTLDALENSEKFMLPKIEAPPDTGIVTITIDKENISPANIGDTKDTNSDKSSHIVMTRENSLSAEEYKSKRPSDISLGSSECDEPLPRFCFLGKSDRSSTGSAVLKSIIDAAEEELKKLPPAIASNDKEMDIRNIENLKDKCIKDEKENENTVEIMSTELENNTKNISLHDISEKVIDNVKLENDTEINNAVPKKIEPNDVEKNSQQNDASMPSKTKSTEEDDYSCPNPVEKCKKNMNVTNGPDDLRTSEITDHKENDLNCNNKETRPAVNDSDHNAAIEKLPDELT